MPLVASQPTHDPAALRRVMVDRQIRTFDVTDAELLSQITDLPREPFLASRLHPFAYSDCALQAGRADGETRRTLPPMVTARLIQSLRIRPTDRALSVAGGGGYAAALMAGLCASVVAVEASPELTSRASEAFAGLGLTNARAVTGSLTDAAGEAGPFDVILVEGAMEEAPAHLLALLSDGGRLASILQSAAGSGESASMAMLWTRAGGSIGKTPLFNAPAAALSAFCRPAVFAF